MALFKALPAHAPSHLAGATDPVYDQDLNTTNSPSFSKVSISGDQVYEIITDAETYSGNNGFAIKNGSSEVFLTTPDGEIIFSGSSAFLGIADRSEPTNRGADKGMYGNNGCLNFWNNFLGQNTLVIADNGDVYVGPNSYGDLSSDGTSSSWGKNFLVAGNISIRDTANAFNATLDAQSQLSADVTLTIPNASGTLPIALISASTALNFGSIGTGGFADLTITLTGAVTTDVVFVTCLDGRGATDGKLIFEAFVSATNTVTVRAHNPTSGSIDPASYDFKVAIIKIA